MITHGKWVANKNEDNTDKESCNHFTNVTSRVFDTYGHFGTAFLDHGEFLKEFHTRHTHACTQQQ